MEGSFVLLLLISISTTHLCIGNEDVHFWKSDAQLRLTEKVKSPIIAAKAKNVIFYLGDGLSLTTITAARILKGQKVDRLQFGEEADLHIDTFPFLGTSKTFCVDAQVADSACSVTAYLSGTKATYGTIGLAPYVTRKSCSDQANTTNHVASALAWAQAAGKSTGVITTTRITDASPAGCYGHVAERDWENDRNVRNDGQDPNVCDDLPEQLILNEPGKNINVILGGGRKNFIPTTEPDMEFPQQFGERTDGKNLINQWVASKHPENSTFVYLREELLAVDTNTTENLFGLFQPDDFGYVHQREEQSDPTLEEMVKIGIEILSRNPNGFFLFVEGGLIDNAHHGNFAQRALFETIEFDSAIKLGDEMTDDEDTLIVVTADHSHVMGFAGHPKRGESILRFPDQFVETKDELPYTTLSYTNGPGPWLDPEGRRRDISNDDFDSITYRHPASVPRNSETHAGEDVLIYAKGPHAHLLSGTNQQSYIPHVVGYAACIGDGVTYCQDDTTATTQQSTSTTTTPNGAVCVQNIKVLFMMMMSLLLRL